MRDIKLNIMAVTIGLLLPLLPMTAPHSSADNIQIVVNKFSNGLSELNVDFTYGGTNTKNSLSLQTGLILNSVELKVSTAAMPGAEKSYPTNVVVDFGGDDKPEWSFSGKGYGPLGRQTVFINNLPYMNASIPFGGGYNDSVAIRLPKSAHVTKATMNLSAGQRIGDPGKVLVIWATYTGYGWDSDLPKKLRAFTSDFSTVDSYDGRSGTPDWATVSKYGNILVWSDWYFWYGFQNGAELGDLMANYVDAGGSLVLATYAMYQYGNFYLSGRFLSENYYAIQPTQSIVYHNPSIGTIDQPGHPVMANVSNIYFPSGYTYGIYQTGVAEGAKAISHWNSGMILAAEKNIGGTDRVDINLMPVSSDTSYYYSCYAGDGDDLFRNALIYGGRKPFTGAVNILNDSTEEFNRTAFSGNYTFPDFSDMLNSYLASASVSYRDAYGNEFVDIPIYVSGPAASRVRFDSLEILYDYTKDIKENPYEGDLTSSLNDMMSTVQGPNNITIPIYISSSSSGRVRLHSLRITATPPIHPPTIKRFWPDAETVVEENTEVEFGVDVVDIYGNPVTIKWFHNADELVGQTRERVKIMFDYDSAGLHTVTVRIENGLRPTEQTWNVTVLDVNREPVIDTFLPVSNPTVRENETVEFSVGASDPDGDPLSYRWALDGKVLMKETRSAFNYTPDFFSAGTHAVTVTASDPGGLTAAKKWDVTVENVNVRPVISSYSPKTNPRIKETQNWTFSAKGFDQDEGTLLTMTWYLDGNQVYIGESYTYRTDFKSAGLRSVKVVVSDGELSDSHEWLVTVDNWNRPPEPYIDSPREKLEFMEGDVIQFSAASTTDPDEEELSFVWREGSTVLSNDVEFQRALPRGLHTVTLEVRDPYGATNSTSVRIRVRYIELAVLLGVSRLDPRAGDAIDVVVTFTNIGDAEATDVGLTVLVDGRTLGSDTIKSLAPGGVEVRVFQWKATRGDHTLSAKVGGSEWSKSVTVASAPPPAAGPGVETYMWPSLLIVIAVLLFGWGAMVLRKR
ncbi:MAG: PKD domain-containing protein [Thermoplasmata archaeon]